LALEKKNSNRRKNIKNNTFSGNGTKKIVEDSIDNSISNSYFSQKPNENSYHEDNLHVSGSF
jgi:hypothetical protein